MRGVMMEAFIGEFQEVRSLTNDETEWLGRIYGFVESNLHPVVHNPGVSVATLSGRLVRCLSEHCARAAHLPGTEEEPLPLPLAYTPVSISDLRAKRNESFSSSLGPRFEHLLSWPRSGAGGAGEAATAEVGEEGERPQGAEDIAAGLDATLNGGLLPLRPLLLCGKVTDRSAEPDAQPDGSLFLRDHTGALQCELSDLPAEWLGELVLLPCWSHVPDGAARGPLHSYVEGHGGTPLLLPTEDPPRPRREAVAALRPDVARCLLLTCRLRLSSRPRFSLVGELLAVAPLLRIREKGLFVLRLGSASSTSSQPLNSSSAQTVLCIVQTPRKLFWSSCLRPHEHYLITNVTMTTVNDRWRVFVDSSSSQLSLAGEAHASELGLKEALAACGMSGRDFQTRSRALAAAKPESLACGTDTRSSPSNFISYRGVVTRVLDAHGALYELDGRVGLCLAYQQGLHLGRGLRVGATLEVHAVHLVRRPPPGQPPAVLVACALSSVRVAAFSPLATPWAPFQPTWSAPVRALHDACLSPAAYFRLLDEVRGLSERLCPDLISERRLTRWHANPADPGIIRSLFLSPGVEDEAPRCRDGPPESAPDSPPKSGDRGWTGCLFGKGPKRDVFLELLEEPHRCVVTPLRDGGDGPWQLPSVSDVLRMAEEKSRKVFVPCCPASSDPAMTPEDSRAATPGRSADSRKTWQFAAFGPKNFEPPVILVGVLRANARSGLLQLADRTAALDCLALQPGPGGQRRTASWDTALLGCLLRVNCFSLVVERFSGSRNTHAHQHHTRIYVQFDADKATVLYRPSHGDQLTTPGKSRPEHARAGPIAKRPPETQENVVRTKRGDEVLSSEGEPPTGRAASRHSADRGTASDRAVKGTVAAASDERALRVRKRRRSGKTVPPAASGERGPESDGAEAVAPATKVSRRDDGAAAPGVCRETRPGESGVGDGRHGPRSVAATAGGGGNGEELAARVFAVTHKEALMLHHMERGMRISFSATVRVFEETARHARGTTPEGARGDGEAGAGSTTQMTFVGEAVKWHALLHPGIAYELLLPSEKVAALYSRLPSVPAGVLKAAACPRHIQLEPEWKIRSLGRRGGSSRAQLEPQPGTSSQRAGERDDHRSELMKIGDILEQKHPTLPGRCEELVSFAGQISERFCYHPHDRYQKLPDSAARKRTGVWLPGDPDLRFVVHDIDNPELSISVYMDPSLFVYPLGLLPGATATFHRLQRFTSRVRKNVYCKFLAVSSITVTSFAGASASSPSDPWGDGAPTVQIADLLSRDRPRVTWGRLGCRVVCIRWLRLKWACAVCGHDFVQGQCSEAPRGTCNSEEGNFTATASVVLDDGTGQVIMYLDGQQVASILALSLPQWEALRHHLLITSGMASFSYSDKFSRDDLEGLTDNVVHALCCRRAVSRLLCLRFRIKTYTQEQESVRTFGSESKKSTYSTLVLPPPLLMCVAVRDLDPVTRARGTGAQEA